MKYNDGCISIDNWPGNYGFQLITGPAVKPLSPWTLRITIDLKS
jgi:hypothetical protein